MKTNVIASVCLVILVGTILFHASDLDASMYPRQVSPPLHLLPGGIYGQISDGRELMPQFFQHLQSAFLSAHQSCLGAAGWNWRKSGFSMCFKPGHNACPVGHPWTRQLTQNYTICLSTLSVGSSTGTY